MLINLFSTKHLSLAVGYYVDQYFIGVSLMFNKHSDPDAVRHLDIVIELFKFFIEIRIGKETR